MKKIRNSISILLLFLFVTACNQQNAVKYNDAIIQEQSKIMSKVLEFLSVMDKDMAKAEKVLKEAAVQAKASIKTVSAMEDFDGSTELRDSALELFKFYLHVVENEYPEMISIIKKGSNITEKDVNRMNVLQQKVTKQEQVLDAKVSAAQANFSKEHNISLQENELQKKIDKIN